MNEPLSVRQVNNMVKMLLETNALLKRLKVSGEITDYRKQSSGHLYFSLKDESGKIRCVQFKSSAASLDFEPENGMHVVISGRLSVYEVTGQYQIIVDTMQTEGTGILYQRFEALKRKLALLGWFDAEIKRPLPEQIQRVGIVTSPSGAAIRDMISVIGRRDPSVGILLCPAQVQGEGAAENIAEGIEKLCRTDVDVIIIGRGGGSIEDLWCFNEEIVAAAVHRAKIPVISAVGHETDFTISDFVADFRAPTPSVAGEMVSDGRGVRTNQLNELKNRLLTAVKRQFQNHTGDLEKLTLRIKAISPENRLDILRLDLDRLQQRCQYAVNRRFEQEKMQIKGFERTFSAFDPKKVLQRGYALIYNDSGALITSKQGAGSGDLLQIRFADGRLAVSVEKEG